MATPRKTRPHTSPVPDDLVIGLIPALQEIVAWWDNRKITLPQAYDITQDTERITFHVERRWIEAIRRQADIDGLTITQVVNEAFRQHFEGL